MNQHNVVSKFFRTTFITSIILSVIGIIYISSLLSFHIHIFFLGLIWGFTVGIAGTAMEHFVFNRYGLRWKFSVMLLSRTIFYFLLITGCILWVVVMHEGWMTGKSFRQSLQEENIQSYLWGGEFSKDVMFALLLVLFISFIRQVSRMMGWQVLLNYVIGKYHHPVSEHRIIMFLDLNDSTSIAEKLGALRYHNFINDFFFRITPAILASKGEIYQYVGDELVVTWRGKQGVHTSDCLQCYFEILAVIGHSKQKFLSEYGYIPYFKAGLHFGDVIVGEIGDVKREIALHGDTMNTAARIRSECSALHRNLLISDALVHLLFPQEKFDLESMGRLRLKGKVKEVELFSITAASPVSVSIQNKL